MSPSEPELDLGFSRLSRLIPRYRGDKLRLFRGRSLERRELSTVVPDISSVVLRGRQESLVTMSAMQVVFMMQCVTILRVKR